MAKFEKGRKRPVNAGRKRGSTNKTTGILREAVLLAAEQTGDPNKRGSDGLVDYLCFVAREYPPAFVSLLVKVPPLQVRVDTKAEVTYRTVDEVDRDIASHGFSTKDVAALLLQAGSIKEEGGDADGFGADEDDEDE